MGHGHAHDVAHFKSCRNPADCFCEVNRYIVAAVVGLIAATAELGIAWYLAGSLGAESDAGHAYADSGFILISAILAYWKHYTKRSKRKIDDVGTWINSLFLIIAGMYIFYRLIFGEAMVAFAGTMMFLAGVVGLAGNYGQFLALGEKHLEDMPDMHSTTRQHIFYDMLYSGAVMFASAIVLIMETKVNFVWQCAVGLLLVVIIAYLILRVIDTEKWESREWAICALSMSLAALFVVVLIVNGSTTAVDSSTAVSLAFAMIAGGVRNIYKRYHGDSGAKHAHHHAGHRH